MDQNRSGDFQGGGPGMVEKSQENYIKTSPQQRPVPAEGKPKPILPKKPSISTKPKISPKPQSFKQNSFSTDEKDQKADKPNFDELVKQKAQVQRVSPKTSKAPPLKPKPRYSVSPSTSFSKTVDSRGKSPNSADINQNEIAKNITSSSNDHSKDGLLKHPKITLTREWDTGHDSNACKVSNSPKNISEDQEQQVSVRNTILMHNKYAEQEKSETQEVHLRKHHGRRTIWREALAVQDTNYSCDLIANKPECISEKPLPAQRRSPNLKPQPAPRSRNSLNRQSQEISPENSDGVQLDEMSKEKDVKTEVTGQESVQSESIKPSKTVSDSKEEGLDQEVPHSALNDKDILVVNERSNYKKIRKPNQEAGHESGQTFKSASPEDSKVNIERNSPGIKKKNTHSPVKHSDLNATKTFTDSDKNDNTVSVLQGVEDLINNAFKTSLDFLDWGFDTPSSPVRPPRREHKRRKTDLDLESCDSDNEFSLNKKDNDGKGSTQSLNALTDTKIKRPHPPKPIRRKLLERSMSDIHDDRLIDIRANSYSDNMNSLKGKDFLVKNLPLLSSKERSASLPMNQQFLGNGLSEKRTQGSIAKKHRPKGRAPSPPVNKNKKLNTSTPNKDSNSCASTSFIQNSLEAYDFDRDYTQDSDEGIYEPIPAVPDFGFHENRGKSPSPPKLPPRNYESSNADGSNVGIPRSRPCSQISSHSDNGSGGNISPTQDSSSCSSEDEEEDEETRREKKRKKRLMYIAREMASSERVFVDILHLLNIDFRRHVMDATAENDKPVVPSEILNKILSHLPMLHQFNEDLLKDLEDRVANWEKKQQIADIFVKKGPFLKLYTSYMKDFSEMCAVLDDAMKKIPQFQAVVKSFEQSPRCAKLLISHYMLKPIQRIPQYKLLLQDYLKYLKPDSEDYESTLAALKIVCNVADHANESFKKEDKIHQMLEIQKSLDGNFEVVTPGRIFIKSGELMKQSRKESQVRMFFLFNDVLLYTTPTATGSYKLNNVLNLNGMRVTKSNLEDFKNEFNIISTHRSFQLKASSSEEFEEWFSALNNAIEDKVAKQSTFESGIQYDKDFVLGEKAPVWIPDSRVSMCMKCTAEFSVTWRRHHCRACGFVVCTSCSRNKMLLKFLDKVDRVCNDCFEKLKTDTHTDFDTSSPSFMSNLSKLLRMSGRSRPKKFSRLKVCARDQNSDMCGYLNCWEKKRWKKHWFVIKGNVLYKYKESEDVVASSDMPLLGYTVETLSGSFEGVAPECLIKLSHHNQPPTVFRTDNTQQTEKWKIAMLAATKIS